MNDYWLYDLPTWLFGAITIALFVGLGLGGVILTRRWVKKLHQVDHSHNDLVSYFLATVTVIYGVTLGLVAVGTWENYSKVQTQGDVEAQVIASLYRDVGSFETPQRMQLRHDLIDYTHNVISVGWPLQQRGIVPVQSGVFLDRFQSDLMTDKPLSSQQVIIQTEVFRQYNLLVEARRARLQSVDSGLPPAVWTMVIVGGIMTIAMTWFFDSRSLAMHLWMTGISAILLGLLIYLIGTLDQPYRGTASLSPKSYEMIYAQMLAAAAASAKP